MIQDDIEDWIKENARAGKNLTRIVVGLAIDFGYTIPVARRIATMTLHPGHGGDNALYARCADAPDIDTTALDLGDAKPAISFEQYFPRIVSIDHLVTPEECELLCQQGGALLAPAEIIQNGDSSRQGAIRSSSTARFPDRYSELVERIERRIARLVDWPIEKSEALQIQRYLPGQQYIPHFDFFERPAAAADQFIAHGGQRLATLVVYLNAPQGGGATYFPMLGLRVAARTGRALFFSYADASVSGGTLHCGETVTAGEKWILTKWFRQETVATGPR